MYVDPSTEGYVFVAYCGLFITKRKILRKLANNETPLCTVKEDSKHAQDR